MDASPEKDSTTVNDYELKPEEDAPMGSNEAEESPSSPPRGDGQLISVDVIMTSDEEDDSRLKLDANAKMVPDEEEDDSPLSPAAEEDDQSPLKRRSTTTGENGSNTITSGESGSWDSDLDTSFQHASNGVNIESNGVDDHEDEEYEVTPPQQAEGDYDISMQQAEEEDEVSMQQAEGDYDISLQQAAEKVVAAAEQGNGSVQSYSKSEEKRAAANTTEAFAGTSSEIEWSEFDVNRDYLASRFKNVDIDALMRTAFRDKQIQGKQIEYREGSSVEEIGLRDGETVIYEAEESDEEVVELEFEAAAEKIHKHEDYGMYCPNCNNRITRVVLRRKIKQRRVLVASGKDRRDLLGCLSCFSVFIPSGNKLNPFKIFGGKRGRDETTQLQEEQLPSSAAAVPSSDAPVTSLGSDVPTTDSSQVEERKFDCFWFLKKRRVDDQSESDLTSPLLQDSSPATTVTRDEAIKREGMQQTSTTTTTSESIQKGGVQTSTTTVTSKSKDVAVSQGGGVQTSTTTVTSESRDITQGGEVQSSTTSTTTVTSDSWDETIKPGGALQTSTTTVKPEPRDEAIKPAPGGNIQVPLEQPASDETTVVAADSKQVKGKGFDVFWFLKRERADESDLRTPLIPAAAQIPSSFPAFSAAPGIMQTSTTTVTSRQPRDDEAIKQEGYGKTSTRDEAIDQQGTFQSSTRDEAFKQDGKFRTSTTTVTFKPGDEAFQQDGKFQTSSRDEVTKKGGYMQTSTRDEAIEQQGTIQTSTGDEAFKQEGPFQKSTTTTTTTTVTSKPGDEASKKEGMFQTSETTVVSWQSDEAIEQGTVVSQQGKDNKSVGIRVPGDNTETSVYDSVTTTESFRGATVGKPERVATDAAVGKAPQTTGQQESKLESIVTTETMRKPEGVAIAAAAVGSVPQIASRQESIIDVYGKQGEVIHQAKAPVQPQLEIRGGGTSAGGDVRITVEETRVETQTIGSTDVAISTTRTEIVTESGPSVWFDILKSIVYGGLMESVISLFVVSLAIASNATTMNVVAIGSAFVVGGFILLLHNLRVLRYGDSTQTSEQTYEVQLGKINRFPLHAFVAVVSHVVFGLIPPVIFGFTFRGDMELKMISVGVASLICIFILAISLAYVRGEQTFVAYFKTVLYYVFLAAIASAAAFGIAYLLQDPFPCPAALDL